MRKLLPKHFKIRPFLALTVAIALSGCAIGPNYFHPASTLPEAAPAVATAQVPVNPTWWTLFGDADLNALVDQTLVANQDLQAAIARLEAAEAAAREARAEALASRFGRDSLLLTLVGQVTNEYLNLRSLDGQIDVTAQTLESRKQALKIVQARANAGTASGLELAQAESALNGAQAQWHQLQRLRALSESQIGLLSGQPGLKIGATSLDKLPLPPTPPAGLSSALLEARPDIRQAEEKLVAANARIGVAKAAYYPTISLTGLFGNESMALSNLFSGGAGIWSAAAGLAMPIFDAGRTGARVDQATAAQKESLANYRKTVQTAFKEVNDAIVGLREYSEEEAAWSALVGASQKALDLAQKRYESGYSGYMDLLDAQRTLNSAQLQYLASRKSRLGAAVDLFKALGGGWQAQGASWG